MLKDPTSKSQYIRTQIGLCPGALETGNTAWDQIHTYDNTLFPLQGKVPSHSRVHPLGLRHPTAVLTAKQCCPLGRLASGKKQQLPEGRESWCELGQVNAAQVSRLQMSKQFNV